MKKEAAKQLYVRYDSEDELSKLMAYLDAHGYENVGHLDARRYTFPVVCVDPNGSYFGTNTTCMAAAASCGRRAISLMEFYERKRKRRGGAFYVSFTSGDHSRRIGKFPTKEEASERAKTAQEKLRMKKKSGIITVFQITSERGFPAQKIYETYEI